jgi:serine/threonine-protein kinase
MMSENMPVQNAVSEGKIGRYTNLSLLGQGGMGAVYRGHDPELDRPVAIKVMLDVTPDFVARFRREAQAIAKLVHANVVQVYDFGIDDQGNPYFVMELIDGTPLDKIVKQRGRLDPAEAIRLIQQAAAGLSHAHRAGIVHRDVKPSNLIVDGRGQVKLVDFGIARVAQAGNALTGAAALMGTPGYMAPEQAAGRPVDHRADIYALGLTLYELLAGKPPYDAPDPISLVVKNMQEPLPDLRLEVGGLPEELAILVEQMAAKDPEQRIQSCEAVVAALDEITNTLKTDKLSIGRLPTDRIPSTNVHGERPAAVAAAVPTGAGTKPKTTWLAVGGIALALTGIGSLVAFRMLQGEKNPGPTQPHRPGDTTVVNGKEPVVTPPEVPKPTPAPKSGLGVKEGPLRIAVLKFKNLTGDKELDQLERGIGESVIPVLAEGVKGVKLIERFDLDSEISEIDRAMDFHFDAATVAQSGKLNGIEFAVQGGVQKAGSKMRITARVVRVETGEVVGNFTSTHKARDVFGIQDAVAAGLSGELKKLVEKEGR